MREPLIKATSSKVLWSCNNCGETFLMYRPLKSHKLCPECGKSMKIEKVVD